MTPRPMTTLASLYRAIVDPSTFADDVLRMAYADFLEESGDGVRAEFVRVQCRLTEPGFVFGGCVCHRKKNGDLIYECELCVLRRRERELLDGVCGLGVDALPVVDGLTRSNCVGGGGYGWYPSAARPTPAWAGIEATFRRGFVEQVSCLLQAWLDHGAAIVSVAPLAHVRVTDKEPTCEFDSTDYGWWDIDGYHSKTSSLEVDDLPHEIWALLCGCYEDGGWKWFKGDDAEHSRSLAQQALSAACLTLARRKAWPCPRCGGDGMAHGADRLFEWSADVDYGKCVVCRGAGWRV